MKILVLTLRIPYPLNDGGAIAMYRALEHLSAAGHEVTLAALNTKKHRQDPGVMDGAVSRVVAVELDTTPNPFAALRSLLFSPLPYNVSRFYSRNFEEQLAELLEAESFDVVQMEGVYLAQYLPTVRRLADAPALLRAHNVEYKIWQSYAAAESSPVKRWYFRQLARKGERFERRKLKKFHGVIALTEEDGADFRQLGYEGPLEAIPVGITLPDRVPEPEPHNALAFLGSLEWLPNLQGLRWFLDKVWPLVLKEIPDCAFHIAGKNPPDSLAKWQYENVRVRGPVPDAGEFIAQYPLVVVPLLSGSGVRVKILEAFAHQRCVVTTPKGISGIRAENGRHLCVAEQPAEFAAACVGLLREPETRARMAGAARKLVEEAYSWRALTQRMTDFYARLL